MSTQMIGFTLEKELFSQSMSLFNPLLHIFSLAYILLTPINFTTHRPRYRMTNRSFTSEVSVVVHPSAVSRVNSSGSVEPPAMLVPSLVRSVSVRGAIQEVRMVQVYLNLHFELSTLVLTFIT